MIRDGKRFLILIFLGICLFCSQNIGAQEKQSFDNLTGESKAAIQERDTPLGKSTAFSFPIAALKTPDLSYADERNREDERFRQSIDININYHFPPVEKIKKRFDFSIESDASLKQSSLKIGNETKNADDSEPRYIRETTPGRGFNYTGAFKQSLLFLGIQHGYAVLGQAKTQRALKHGSFFRDYFDSVKSLRGWDDGGRFFTNYIAHPMQGSLTGFVYVQNSPEALREQFSMSPKYWKTRMKAMLWSTAWSTQFEIGPISQASLGNVGLSGKQTWEDIVVTPTLGTAMLITEDALDRYLVKGIERRTNNLYLKVLVRMLFNPTRNFSNLLRFREPWYRDRPSSH